MPSSPFIPERSGFCASCGGPVSVTDASFCKECGAPLGAGIRLRHDLGWNPWAALALSILPGLGQLYKGRPWQAAGWLVLVAAGYSAQPLGYLLHMVCGANAALAGAIEDSLLAALARGSSSEQSRRQS